MNVAVHCAFAGKLLNSTFWSANLTATPLRFGPHEYAFGPVHRL
jgi:hypothetical protein